MVSKGDDSKMPIETVRWNMAERFGWKLEYIDALEMSDFHEFLQVEDGKAKARTSILHKGSK